MKTGKKIKSLKLNWKFDKLVAKNFDSHVIKSVPFYKISHDISCNLSDFFLREKVVQKRIKA